MVFFTITAFIPNTFYCMGYFFRRISQIISFHPGLLFILYSVPQGTAHELLFESLYDVCKDKILTFCGVEIIS